jgi:hypothetical protein
VTDDLEALRANVALLERAAKAAARETQEVHALLRAAEAKLAVALPFVAQHALAMTWGAQAIDDAEEGAAQWAIGMVEDADAITRRVRLRAALRISVLEAERDRRDASSRDRAVPGIHADDCERIGCNGCECICTCGATIPPWSVDKPRHAHVGTGDRCTRCGQQRSRHPEAPRIATPADAADIRENLVPSQARVVVKLVAESRSADALMELAREQAAKVRAEERAAFQAKWGRFGKCECGARGPTGFACRVPSCVGEVSETGYAPPPRTP